MNRILLTFFAIVVLSAGMANAQRKVNVGGNFNINFDDYTIKTLDGKTLSGEGTFQIVLKPKIFWYLNEKMQIGGRMGFGFGRLTTGLVYDEDDGKEKEAAVGRAIGWSIAPFFGYKLLTWKIFNVWLEANVFAGQNYNIAKSGIPPTEWKNQTQYGFQILPVLSIDLNETLALDFHLGILSLGWLGTVSNYSDHSVITSSWDMRKGGFDGLAQGFYDYGIGISKRF